ncbi:type I restriction endonuclease subunit R [Coleofasciculus sp. FACHB-64]|uniref:type I restriction endonuclease subunit R n=1 Tax=Cyanophyceae TaxID=3028117 RepID=UPI00168601FD|nr:DEAD/DEAH box helicase family protein [Coleofasciculus sp. FACHB-64]MBD2047286.1 type I restriction endonuclease subunit R [Coleofasciculus sp. FACHB-64]
MTLEKDLEAIIERSLIDRDRGYEKRTQTDYDKARCLIPKDVIQFIEQTQAETWEQLKQHHGDATETEFLNYLASEINSRGTLDVLRNDIKTYGCTFKLAYFQPNSRRNPELQTLYEQNSFTILRQLHYSQTDLKKSLDWGIFLNGLPIFTAELKNHFTGQTVEHAKKQYCTTRDPNESLLKFGRCLCHFALDPDLVFITTQLQGNDTKFLPFNKGHKQGKGNPPDPNPDPNRRGCRTAYLAEEIWHPDSVLNLIKNFIQLTPENRLIFPRYHQLDAVRKLLDDALAKGAGQRYLIQHSAGSGKSNTIAWLSHQLKNLFDANDQRVFNSIIVISDRKIINEQLQDTILQFEQVSGVVATPPTGKELKKDLEEGKQVIVCTLKLFPQVLRLTNQMLNRRFAILIDEAHSSQGGKTTRQMNAVLADVEEDSEDFILRETARRGRLNNLSYFAFTATPKNTTLEYFGQKQTDGKYYPFHLYSMRQAIEEGFILDVLQNYTTYEQYYSLLQATTEDPRCSTGKLVRALHNFVNLNEEMINEKVEIIVGHFCDRVQRHINGKAKAMLVTSSRAQAVRYKQAVDAYIQEKEYTFKTLVAFSQTVTLNGVNYTEYNMNTASAGEPIHETAEAFKKDEFRILIVADKFQTGFDQPLLHTMYVDKPLRDIKAVQTLSRLNRCHSGKNETMVLDFVNDWKTIKNAFQDYYTATTLSEGTQPNRLYTLQRQLQQFGFYDASELGNVTNIYYRNPQAVDQLEAAISPVVERFNDAEEDNKNRFRDLLTEYVRLYLYLSQIVKFTDVDLEKLYSLGHLLLTKIQPSQQESPFTLPQGIELEAYRIQQTFSGSINLNNTAETELQSPVIKGSGTPRARTAVPLSQVIQEFNNRYGVNLTDADKVCVEIVTERLSQNEKLKQQVQVNADKAQTTFNETAQKQMISLFRENTLGFQDFYSKTKKNKDFETALLSWMFFQYCNKVINQEQGEAEEV